MDANAILGAAGTTLRAARGLVQEHPYRTAGIVTGVALLPFGGTAVVAGAGLKLLGFGTLGPVAGM